MTTPIHKLGLAALASAALSTQASALLIPNGDFSTLGGASWDPVNGGGSYSYQYPEKGGNPDGHGVIDNTGGGGGFGIWVGNGGDVLALDTLGLSAGMSYTFTQDMRIVSGPNMGGFKVDFFTGEDLSGSTGDLFPRAIGDGSTWETYSFPVNIPTTADGIKIVPLWGADSAVAYDNICVDTTPISEPPFLNGAFEYGTTGWLEIGSDTTWDYPESGGNLSSYGVMTHGGEANTSGIWVANRGAPIALSDLGLEPGQTVTFLQDMRLLSGDMIGGLKVEFLDGATALGDSDEMRVDPVGDGNTWETYSFNVPIPTTADHIKVVPLWGAGSSVAYDNIRFRRPTPSAFTADIVLGNVITWSPEDETLIHQPQESFDGKEWDNVGAPVIGDSSNSRFKVGDAPFYRVEVFQNSVASVIVNGSFELPGGFDCAESWECFSPTGQPPTLADDARTGDSSMRIAVINDNTPNPNNSEIQQNVASAGGVIVPGESYDFTFWAKQISSGVSYVQNYRLQWLNGADAIVGEIQFTPFTGGDGVWKEITTTGLVPPDTAVTAYIQIFGATGAVAGDDARGEVLIDDVSLATSGTKQFDVIDAELSPGLQVSWDTENGTSYQVQSSAVDLDSFVDFGSPIIGNGQTATMSDLLDPDGNYYRVLKTIP